MQIHKPLMCIPTKIITTHLTDIVLCNLSPVIMSCTSICLIACSLRGPEINGLLDCTKMNQCFVGTGSMAQTCLRVPYICTSLPRLFSIQCPITLFVCPSLFAQFRFPIEVAEKIYFSFLDVLELNLLFSEERLGSDISKKGWIYPPISEYIMMKQLNTSLGS